MKEAKKMKKMKKIKVKLNDEIIEINDKESINIEDFLDQKNIQGEYFALMLNGEFVPRSHYSSVLIKEKDEIDIIKPMQGG